MIFMHKLSRRLALLKDAICIVAALAAMSCKVERRTAPTSDELARLSISPILVSLHVNQGTDLTVQGTNQAGDMAPLSISFDVRGTAGGSITGVTTSGRGRAVGHFKAGQTPGQDSVFAHDTSGVADTAVIVVTPPPVASVAVTPSTATVLVGNTTPFSATTFDSTGTVLTGRTITWASATPAVATVNAAGVASGVAPGSAKIIATSESKSDTATLTVSNVPVASVTIAPATASIFVGQTQAFTATLRDSAGGILTGRVVTWSSTATPVATVNSSGVVTGGAAGTASIIASSGGQSGTASVTVVDVPVASVTLTPASASIIVGATQAFTATLRDSAGGVLTGRVVTWSSTATGVATVNTAGVATGLSAGSASIIASSGGKSATSVLTVVSAPVVASVTITPATASIFLGQTQAFTATLRDSAGAIITGPTVTWSSNATAVATVSTSGVATGVSAGSASISAASGGHSGTAALTVVVVPVASVTLTPATASINVGATQAFTATLRDSAGGVLTGRVVTWSSTATAVATVNTSGVATGVSAGSSSIIAASGGRTGTSALTVTTPPPPPPPPPPGGIPDPTLLPVGNGQAPNFAAYEALNVRSAAAGFSYNDPVTGVRVWKVSSPSVPLANTAAGHDYAAGGQEVSRGWGPNGNTHTIHIGAWVGGAYKHWLVDFTRGVGFSNYRQLTVSPGRDLMCSFSNVVGQERIMYIHTGSQLVRYNTATMQTENTGNFPLVQGAYAWLQQDKNDVWFAGLASDNQTAWVWNSQTNELRIHLESFTNEVYLEPDGHYLLFTSGGAYTTTRLWDLAANTFGAVQQSPAYLFHVSHAAALRGMYVGSDYNGLAEMRYDIQSTDILTGTTAYSYEIGDSHHGGMWIQSDADLGGNLLKQWSIANGESGPDYSQYSNMRWKLAIGIIRADGSDSRLLLHHYGMTPNSAYFDYPWGKSSPDGKVVIFNSNMNNAGGRWDLFVAEVPLR